MPVWAGDPPPAQTWLQRIAWGDGIDLSQWTLGSHTGTHLDAPSHFVAGAADLEVLGLDPLVGPCLVVDLSAAESVQVTAGERLLFRTVRRGAEAAVASNRVGLNPAAAWRLVASGVRLVGIDALSIETPDSVAAGAPVHRALLSAGVVILEGLALEVVEPGEYFLVALPLRLRHSEASPVRAVLLPRDPAQRLTPPA